VLYLSNYAAPLTGIFLRFFQLSAINGFTPGCPSCPHQDLVIRTVMITRSILLFEWLAYALGPSATLWFSEGAVAVFLLSMGAAGLRFARGSSSRPDDLVVRVLGSVGSVLSGPLYLPCISMLAKYLLRAGSPPHTAAKGLTVFVVMLSIVAYVPLVVFLSQVTKE
jgi:hypothetical protein